MSDTVCIPDDRLKQLLVGELSDQEAQPLEQHLLECPSCVARTRSLQSADTLVAALHRVGAQGAGESSAVIDRLVKQLSDRSQLSTHPSLLDETQAPVARSAARGVPDLVARFEPPAAPDELGRLGGFRVLKLLGQGGMGAVFLAEDLQLRRQIALKLLRPEQANQPGAADRFLREARAAAAVRHDHVVTIYQVGQAQGLPFIAQELLEGESLEDRLKREGKLPLGEAIRIAGEIAAGLSAAHERGLLHRDVKPSNVWLEGRVSGEWSGVSGEDKTSDHLPLTTHHSPPNLAPLRPRSKLLDFGLAREQQGDEQLTQSGAIVGTPAYMSPEQAQSKPLDARTDLFSLGGILFRMVTGRLAFQGADVLSMLRSLAVDEPPTAHSLNKEVPVALSQLIADLLQKDRDARPASAADVQIRLAAIPRDRPLASPRKPASQSAWIAALGAGVLAPLIALAVFLTIKTPYGEVAVELGAGVKPDDVHIEVARDGEVNVADAKKGWMINVKEGQYQVQLTGGKDKLAVSPTAVTVTRSKKTHLKVTLKPPPATPVAAAPASIPAASHEPPPRAAAPFTATEAQAHQRAWAAHLGLPDSFTNSLGMKFVLIPPGEFLMGVAEDEMDEWRSGLATVDPFTRACLTSEGPRHKVVLTQPFYLAVHEVTQAQFTAVQGSNPAYFAKGGPSPQFAARVANLDTSAHAVDGIIWPDAAEFAAKLSEREKLQPLYVRAGNEVTVQTGVGYRLPTEAEWEFACRAGTTARHLAGNSPADLTAVAWWGNVAGQRPHPVGQLQPNAFGLCDMLGNVWEWTQDAWEESYYATQASGIAIDPKGPPVKSQRVIKGGSWWNPAFRCRPAARVGALVNDRVFDVGFRLVLPVDAVRRALGGPLPSAHAGYALEFNGKDSYVDLPTLRYDGSHPITVEATIAPAQSDAQGVVFGDRGLAKGDLKSSGMALKFPIHSDAAVPRLGAFLIGDEIGYRHSLSRQEITPRRTIQVAGVRDGSTIRLFIDGRLQSTKEIGSYRPRSGPFNIGASFSADDLPVMLFAGIVDELRFSSIARYAADYTPALRLDADEHTLALYHFDEGAGDVLTDSSGHGHDGKIVNARWVPGIAGVDPDRHAAEQVLALGGTATVRIQGSEQAIKPGTALPDEHFDLVRIEISRQPQLTDAVLQRLTEARQLVDVQLYLVPVTDAALEHLARLPKLERLMLTETRVTGSGLKHWRGRTDLKNLGVDGGPFTDQGLSYAAELPNLELLWLGNTQITSAGLVHLRNLKQLKYLSVGETQVGDEGLSHLQGLTGLKRLVLSGTKVTDAGLAQLQGFQNLEELEIAHSGLTDVGLALLAANGPKSIRELRIWTTRISDDGLVHLKALPRLNVLYLGSTNVTDGGLQALSELKNLKELDLTGTLTTAAGIDGLKRSLPNCRIIDDTAGNPRARPRRAAAPFSPAEAKALQAAWASHLGLPVAFSNSLGMKFVLVPPGEFTMGQSPADAAAVAALHPKDDGWKRAAESSAPAHRVRLTQPFYLGQHEVTQRQYQQVTGKNPSHFSASGAGKAAVAGLDTADFPVDSIDFAAAAAFCEQLGKQEGLAAGEGYRLPTEAEWEFACRAGSTSAWPAGENENSLKPAAWYAANSGGKSHPVGRQASNPLGLFDLAGNVWEWCQDWYDAGEYARRGSGAVVDPTGPPKGTARVLRGGCFGSEAADLRSAARATPFSNRNSGYGLRAALSVAGVRKLLEQRSAVEPPRAIAPFTAAEGRAHQIAWAKHLGLPREYSNSLGMNFVLLPPGEYTRGASQREIDAAREVLQGSDKEWIQRLQGSGPEHKVVLTQPTYLAACEVTQAEYREVMGKNPAYFAADSERPELAALVAGRDTSRHPVEGITWFDAAEFCQKLSDRERLAASGYRLPTEATWEFACRGGTTTRFSAGPADEHLALAGWFGKNAGNRTHPVGELAANAFGLYDMHGNVMEWCQDAWEVESYEPFRLAAAIDPSGPAAGSRRILRGGSWGNFACVCASAMRCEETPHRSAIIGFRVALPADGVRALLASSSDDRPAR